MFSPGIEPGTICVLGRCDNHYTTETDCKLKMLLLGDRSSRPLSLNLKNHLEWRVHVLIYVNRLWELSFKTVRILGKEYLFVFRQRTSPSILMARSCSTWALSRTGPSSKPRNPTSTVHLLSYSNNNNNHKVTYNKRNRKYLIIKTCSNVKCKKIVSYKKNLLCNTINKK